MSHSSELFKISRGEWKFFFSKIEASVLWPAADRRRTSMTVVRSGLRDKDETS